MKTETVFMYRPCGEAELKLVAESGYREWPPRLAEQPIFILLQMSNMQKK